MQISDEYIIKYQKLYYQRFNEQISRELAYEQFSNLITLIKIVYQPITKKDYKTFKDKIGLTNKNKGIL